MPRDGRRLGPGASTAIHVAAIVAAALLAELLVFNFPSVESLWSPRVSAESSEEGPEGGLELSFGDGADVRGLRVSAADGSPASYSVYLRDEGNAVWYLAGTVSDGAGDSYVRIHPAGAVLAVRVVPDGGGEVASVGLNERVPPSLSGARVCLVCAVALLAYGVGLCPLLKGVPLRRGHVVALALAASVALAAVAVRSGVPLSEQAPSEHQYFELAQALSKGHVHLDAEPSEGLLSLENPYDTGLREAEGVEFLWDHAYRDGRYYVYFGVLPCLVYHLPWYLLTGGELPNWAGVAASCALFAAGLAFMLDALFRWAGRRPSASWFLGVYAAALCASNGVGAATGPDLYCLPISTALALSAWGLGCWLRAAAPREGGGLRLGWGVAGSALMALIALCRPQLLLACAVGVPLIVPPLRRSRAGARGRAAQLAACLAPFAVVLAAAGAYNAARFGSPLDFGASYNLTSNDMTLRGWNVDRTVGGALSYLLQPPSYTLSPFGASEAYPIVRYLGTVITGVLPGGILVVAPVLPLSLAWLARGRAAAPGGAAPRLCSACLWAAGAAILVVDANVAGVLARYYMDFGTPLAYALAFAAASRAGDAAAARAGATRPGEAAARREGLALFVGALAVTAAFTALWAWFKLYG